MKLIIGNQRYSSWSMRPWLIVKHLGLPVDIEAHNLFDGTFADKFSHLNVPAKVPLLIDGQTLVWDSLAIVEYLAEHFEGVLPKDAARRNLARCAMAEMHSGFAALRSECPMDIRAIKKIATSAGVLADLQRINAIWQQFELDPFLCGEFSAIDAYFAPVAVRASGFELPVCERFATWQQRLFGLNAFKQWISEGLAESYEHAPYNVGPVIGIQPFARA
ncbi:MAG: glutathione S-transferase family protein [Gammaproteobacteria bacterium]|nr:glutathione S-transferase family protein [Gammaproteobacteria bacterium]